MFLPPLIFESAMSCNYFIFSRYAHSRMGSLPVPWLGMYARNWRDVE